MSTYEAVGTSVQIGVNILWGACFAWYASRLCRQRFRGAALLCAVCCAGARAAAACALPTDAESGTAALRVLIMFAASLAVLAAMFQAEQRMYIYAAMSWTALFQLSMFLAYSVVLAADPLYPAVTDTMLHSGVTDPDAVGSAARLVAASTQLADAALLSILCIFCCRSIARDLAGEEHLDTARFRLLCLPAAAGVLMAVLLRLLLIRVTDGVPSLLFDSLAPLRVLVPVLAAVSLGGIVAAARTSWDITGLERERAAGIAARERVRAMKRQMAAEEAARDRAHRMRHDLRNTLSIIRSLSTALPEGTELTAYLDDLAEDAKGLETSVVTGDAVVDALLEAKRSALQSAVPGAVFDASEFFLPNGSGVSSYDLGIILGNALDNALEALARQKTAERFVRLTSFRHGKLLGIRVENSMDGSTTVAVRDDLPAREHDPIRGTGLRTIRYIALRHNGAVDWKCADGVFTLAVLLDLAEPVGGEQDCGSAKTSMEGAHQQ